MEINKWLPGRPIITNDILISGFYNGERDDTEYYDAYTYPTMEYINRFNASRFSNEVKQESTHRTYPELGAYLNDETLSEPLLNIPTGVVTEPADSLPLFGGYVRSIGKWELIRDLYPSFTRRDLFLQRVLLHRIGYIPQTDDTVIHYNVISYNDIVPFPILVQEYKNRYHKRITSQLRADKNNDLEYGECRL